MLLDTSGLLCCFDRAEPRGDKARLLFDTAPVLLTHSYVLAEFMPLCDARRLNRARALDFAGDLLDNEDMEVIWVDEPRHRGALTLLRARPDKGYSLCDAVSFVLMREHGLTDALTTDRHFEQEGFVRLLPP